MNPHVKRVKGKSINGTSDPRKTFLVRGQLRFSNEEEGVFLFVLFVHSLMKRKVRLWYTCIFGDEKDR